MVADDHVLVAYMPDPADFLRLQTQGWYRLPYVGAPRGRHAAYFAFYFGRKFGPQKYAIHYFAAQRGHELVRRCDLIPTEPDHPRAHEWYYQIQLGPVWRLTRPIVSLRRRRVTFIHTTIGHLQTAREIGDLTLPALSTGLTLRERAIGKPNGRGYHSGGYQTVRMAPPSTMSVSPVM